MDLRDIAFVLALVFATVGLMLSLINSGILDERHEPVRYVHPRKRKETVYDRIAKSPEAMARFIEYISTHEATDLFCGSMDCEVCDSAYAEDPHMLDAMCRKCLENYLDRRVKKGEILPWEELE